MLNGRVSVANALGLHARAAAKLVRVARSFKSEIRISRLDNGESTDAKSILGVLGLAATKGTTLKLDVEGDDQSDALEAITKLFESGFGESN